ncbi:MAG: 7TM diverse intracellular signaling domain-containing protein, partial [Sulfuritalea sp.]|nr:7TM diverse intracellular signaling domain-containing protein [Sulfuritalea sp.]
MRRLLGSGASAAVDTFLYRLSVYGVPIAIGIASLVALVLLPNVYPLDGASRIEFAAQLEDGPSLTPQQALRQLAGKTAMAEVGTRRSELPFWFSFEVPASDRPLVVELPSRHALDAACWTTADFRLLGSASRSNAEGAMKVARTGFALQLGQSASAVRLLCRARHTGPGNISVILWPAEKFSLSELKFHRNSGLLDGGLIVLSLFVLLTAIVSREWLYVLFAAWLMVNLRMAALTAGWDAQWLEGSIPPDWIVPMRKLTTYAYYMLTIMLFSRLFSHDLKRVKYAQLLHISQWSCLPLLLAALALPFASYLPLLWVLSTYTVAVIVFLLVRILMVTRSKVAMWYGAGMGVAMLASLNEVVAAAVGFRDLIGSVNSVTAALSSSLLSALAIAEQIRQEKLERRKAQDELRNTYEAIPIGLFSLDKQGSILQCNPAYKVMMGRGSSAGQWSDDFDAGAWQRMQTFLANAASEDLELTGRAGAAGRRK